MTVSISPFGGVGAQFFNNNGVILSGGKIYTYAAGTSTPATTYTTNSGLIAHSNPIVLDSSGRVPGGEIWLTQGSSYKFVLKDSLDNLIGTYDNIYGISAIAPQEGYVVATEGQTVVTVPFNYFVGTNSLRVYVNGSKQIATLNYTETTSSSVTFLAGLNVGDVVEFVQ